MIDYEVNLSGPLFDGRAVGAMRVMRDEVLWEITAQARADWMTHLNASIKHPTPYYETQITAEVREDAARVHDRAVIYGPWLEGTSERNRTTRFRGYAALRRAVQALPAKIPALTQAAVARAVQRMGGTP